MTEALGPGAGETQRWPGLLAAIALSARREHAQLAAVLGGDRAPPSPSVLAATPDWSLGDPMLGNLLAAWVAEARGDRAQAVASWRQVAAQARLGGNEFVAELALVALQRLS